MERKDSAKEAFAEAYDEHVWHVYGFVGYRVGQREVAEDLTQATFERALRAWHRFDPKRATCRTWLLAIAMNLVIDHYRRAGPNREQPMGDEALLESAPAPDSDPAERLGVSPELEQAMAALDERERTLIALRFGGDLNGPEIAELTGLTLANVQQILSRAMRRLRTKLENGSATLHEPRARASEARD